MNATRQSDGTPGDSQGGTLGDLLYADQARTRISEKDWIELVQSIAAGNQAALHALYERTHRIVFTLIMRITANRQSAEELTLDVFHGVWQRASRYDPADGSVLGWIMNQARSRAIDRVRFDTRLKRTNGHADHLPPEAAASGVDELVDVEEQGRFLRNALTILTPDERQAIETAFFAGLTYAEVAAQLNQPVGTVKTRIRSALQKLREKLASGAKEP